MMTQTHIRAMSEDEVLELENNLYREIKFRKDRHDSLVFGWLKRQNNTEICAFEKIRCVLHIILAKTGEK